MATFTVHAPEGDLDEAIAADRLILLREGFSWAALLVPFVWAPWRRLWLVFAGWLVASAVIQAIDVGVSASAGTILSLAFAVWFAMAAVDLRRWTLERKGWRLVAIIEARDLAEAEIRFLTRWADPARPHVGEGRARLDRGGDTPRFPTRDLPPIVGFAGLSGGTR